MRRSTRLSHFAAEHRVQPRRIEQLLLTTFIVASWAAIILLSATLLN